MSYCRNNGVDSDVYMYHHVAGWLECCGCSLEEDGFFMTTSRVEMIAHMADHREHGDKVPDRVFVRLQEEIETEGVFAS